MFKFDSATDRRHFIVAGVLVAIFTVIMFLLLDFGLPLPDQASAEAVIIDTMIRWHLVLIAFLFSLVMVFMVYTFVVFRKREGDDSEGEHFEGHTGLEIAWTGLPLILVVIFAFYGIWALNKVTAAKENEIAINVTGQQWAWSFEYPGGVITNTLTLPVNQPARMDMNTIDVMHAFWVPEFRVKQDLSPGMITKLRFTPTVEGEYDLVCAELCGLTHYDMKAKVKVVSQAEFTAWLETEIARVNPALAATR